MSLLKGVCAVFPCTFFHSFKPLGGTFDEDAAIILNRSSFFIGDFMLGGET
jgi:hypothetical protein